ncbi:MAG: T9SS type A sorting domain-containing protein [Paludibacter sp.]|nr:T9SS type A sorting domain-containing protein [Paludibacter sp.]
MRKNYLLCLIFVLSACFFSVNAANVPKRAIASVTEVSTDTLFYVDFNTKPGTFTTGDIYTASTGNANKTNTINSVVFGAGPNGERINMNAGQSASQFGSGATSYVSATANDDGATKGAFSFLKAGASAAAGGYITLPQVQGPADITVWSASGNSTTQKYDMYFSTDGGTTYVSQGSTSVGPNKFIYKNIFTYQGIDKLLVKLVCTTSSNTNSNLYIYDVLVTAQPALNLTSGIGTDNQTVTTALTESISNIVYTWGSIATSASVSWTGTADASTPPAGIIVTTDPVSKTVTLSGTPTSVGNYGYNMTSTNGIINSRVLTGTIKVVNTPVPLISLTSVAGTNVQKATAGGAMTDIQYTWGGSATSATIIWTGTENASTPPSGIIVTSDAVNEKMTISGSPLIPGTYSWIISSTDGTLVSGFLTGTLTVVPPPTLSLTSGSDNQTVPFCSGITGIVYTFGGSATSASILWTGTSASSTSPAGITVTTDNTAKTVTISGMPYVTGNYGYSITSTDGILVTPALTGKIVSSATAAVLPSFPGAVGYGSHATGGRFGSVYHVTNLNDSGTGSFRDAVSVSNRIIVFDVSGYINLITAVSAKSNLTIAGQTAPGEGIGFRGGEISFANQSNIICRNIRIRPGSETPSTGDDALSLYLARNVIVDHCSFEFAPWNNIDGVSDNYTVYPVTGITIQNCIDANPTYQQFGAHCESVISQWTFYRNIFANSHNRNPLAKINEEFINNVHYNNEAGFTTHTSTTFKHDIVNNYFVHGPASTSTDNTWFQVDANQSIYYSGNLKDKNLDGILNGSETTPYWYSGVGTLLTVPWSPLTSMIPTVSAPSAYRIATSSTGTLPYDQMDSLIINQVKTLGLGTVGFTAGTVGPSGGLYTDQTQLGLSNNGYGIIRSGVKDVDSDNDGMPDYWEVATGSNVNVNDAMTIAPDGYSLIEHYLNWLAGIRSVSKINASVDIDLNQFTGGFSSVSPVFEISNNLNGTAVLTNNHTVHFIPAANFSGLGGFKFTVTGSDNTSYTDSVVVLVTNNVSDGINELKNAVSIYPNPASHVLILQNTDAATYEIYDISGRLALKGQTKQAGSNQQIDISKLNDGAFMLKVTTNHSNSSFNFIKKN